MPFEISSQSPASAGPEIHRGALVPSAAALSVVVMATDADARVVDAVGSLIGQDVDVEIIVVNSGGGSVKPLLTAHSDRIVLAETDRRLLPGGTRNLGIALASAEVIGFLAADCLAARDWARLRLAAHRQGKLAVASALRPAVGPPGEPPAISWACYALLHMRRAPEFPVDEVARYGGSYHRSLFERHGLFRDDVRIGEDSEFNARIGAEGALAWVPEIVTYHRYPTTLPAALRDMFDRGGRMLHWQRTNSRAPLLAALKRVVGSWLVARRLAGHTTGDVRKSLDRAGGYIELLTVSFGLGALFAYLTSAFGPRPR